MTIDFAHSTIGGSAGIRFGLVGAGRQATKYVPSLSAAGRVTALFHPRAKGFDGTLPPLNAGGAAVVIPNFAEVSCFRDFGEFVHSPAFDVAVITSPTEFHVEQALALAAAGKWVLVEKPLATSATAVLKLRPWAHRIIPILPVPFFAAYHTLVAAVRAGTLGDVQNVTLRRECPPPSWSMHFANPACGGALWDLGIHDLHFACLHFGELVLNNRQLEYSPNEQLPLRVEASFTSLAPHNERVVPGCTVSIVASWRLQAGFIQEFTVQGTRGALALANNQLTLSTDELGSTPHRIADLPSQGFAALLTAAIALIRGERTEIPELDWVPVVRAHQLLEEIQAAQPVAR